MKKLIFVFVGLMAFFVINAQSLEDIINKYTLANKLDKIADFKTIKITAKTSVMGMDSPMEMWMKNPNKIKTIISIKGQEIVQVFDGKKGYTINLMTGSTEPVEMTADQLKSVTMSNKFNNFMAQYLKDGKLTLEGEDNVNGKPAFKIKSSPDGGNSATMYIDKSTYLLLKTVTNVNQGGSAMAVESFASDYTETNGILLPMKTTMSVSGIDMVTTFTNVEVDIPMDDSIFELDASSQSAMSIIETWDGKTSQDKNITIKVKMVNNSAIVAELLYNIELKGFTYSTTQTMFQPIKISANIIDGKFSYSGSGYEISGSFEGDTLKGNLSVRQAHPQSGEIAKADVTFTLKKRGS